MPPFQPRTLEVDDKADFKTGYPQIVQHSPDLYVTNAFDRLCVYDHRTFHNKVRHVLTYEFRSVIDRKAWLLLEVDARGLHLDT
jgi:hypothetical protein